MSKAQLQTLWANGAKAWADVPNASQWVEELRGNVEEKRMSDTPRTDACEVRFSTLFAGEDAMWVPSKKAKEVERELNAANERIEELQSEIDGFKAWNWKLREVGEDMDYRLTLHASHEPILKKWKEIRNGLNP